MLQEYLRNGLIARKEVQQKLRKRAIKILTRFTHGYYPL